jgi:putative endonuclease
MGKIGEAAAAAYLTRQGYSVLVTNWRCRFGELDIVARTIDLLVFVEVKTRYMAAADDVLLGFTTRKRDRVLLAIYHYLEAHNLSDENWRFDLMGITISTTGVTAVEHLENALDW